MGEDELVNFILKSHERGRIDEQIVQQLLSVGWRKDKVEEAYVRIKERKAAEYKAAMEGTTTAVQQLAGSPELISSQPQQSASPAGQPSSQPQSQAAQMPPQQTAQPAQSTQPKPVSPLQQASSQAAPQKKGFLPSFGLFGKKPAQQPVVSAPAQTAQPQPQTSSPQPVPAQSQPAQTSPQPSISSPASQPQPAGQNAVIRTWQPGQQPPRSQQPTQQPQQAAAPAQQKPGLSFGSLFAKKKDQEAAFEVGAAAQQQAQQSQQAVQPQPQGAPQQAGTPPQKGGFFANKMMVYAVIIILALVVAGLIYFVFIIPGATKTETKRHTTPKPSVPVEPQSPPPNTTAEQKPSLENETELFLCEGKELDCMANASKECQKANTTHESEADLSGLIISSSTYIEIKGQKGALCQFYISNRNASARITQNARVSLLIRGTTSEQIDAIERSANRLANSTIGLSGTCLFKSEDLHGLLSRWNSGVYSNDDYENGKCAGSIFTTPKPNYSKVYTPSPQFSSLYNNSSSKIETQVGWEPISPHSNTYVPPSPAMNNSTAQNSTNQSAQSQNFTRTKTYKSSWSEDSVDRFCWVQGGAFYRAHYELYFGGECTSSRGQTGFDARTVAIARCKNIPCCYALDAFKEYSVQYDSFECGFEQ